MAAAVKLRRLTLTSMLTLAALIAVDINRTLMPVKAVEVEVVAIMTSSSRICVRTNMLLHFNLISFWLNFFGLFVESICERKERTKERRNEVAKERRNEGTKERKNEGTKGRRNGQTEGSIVTKCSEPPVVFDGQSL